jgi:hypothetical protein
MKQHARGYHFRESGEWGSTRDLLNILDMIAKAGAGFKSLTDTWADTTTAHGRLMLTVLGGLAEFERELILARTGDGRRRAKARGVRFGRPPALTMHQRQEAIQRLTEAAALVANGMGNTVTASGGTAKLTQLRRSRFYIGCGVAVRSGCQLQVVQSIAFANAWGRVSILITPIEIALTQPLELRGAETRMLRIALAKRKTDRRRYCGGTARGK